MEKKKMLSSIFIIIILALILFTGCTGQKEFPVQTSEPRVSWEYESVHLIGFIAVPFCKASNHKFVYDTEPHENWEDYKYSKSVDGLPPNDSKYNAYLYTNDLQHYVTYYVRAVANCYDFKRPYQDYKEGYYAGSDKTFYIDWN